MSYDSSSLVTVSFPIVLTTITQPFQAPKSGHLYDINLSATTTWAGTTPGRIDVGILGTLNKFGTVTCGTLAAGLARSARYANLAPSVVNPHADFLAGTNILITYVIPVGGSPAGAGLVIVTFQLDP